MKIVKPTFEILNKDGIDPQKYIENIARTCYKSEDKITDISNRKFISMLQTAGHWAMLEHYLFTYEATDNLIRILKKLQPRFITLMETGGGNYISFSARSLLDIEANLKSKLDLNSKDKEVLIIYGIVKHIINTVIKDYDCFELFGRDRAEEKEATLLETIPLYPLEAKKPEDVVKYCKRYTDWFSVKFTVSRAISHELVRHRIASFAQESQRYVAYTKEKNGGEISVIEPCFFNPKSKAFKVWADSQVKAEKDYFYLINEEGAKAQEAREVLTNSTKTEIIVTATHDEWYKIFSLRCDSPAHPAMRQVMIPLYREMCAREPLIYTPLSEAINLDFDFPLATQIK